MSGVPTAGTGRGLRSRSVQHECTRRRPGKPLLPQGCLDGASFADDADEHPRGRGDRRGGTPGAGPAPPRGGRAGPAHAGRMPGGPGAPPPACGGRCLRPLRHLAQPGERGQSPAEALVRLRPSPASAWDGTVYEGGRGRGGGVIGFSRQPSDASAARYSASARFRSHSPRKTSRAL